MSQPIPDVNQNKKLRAKDFPEQVYTHKEWSDKLLEKIDPLDLVEPCEPDCSPERHAYHEGQWALAQKLEKYLIKAIKELI